MKRAFAASCVALTAILVVAVGCGSSRADTAKSETQRQFGVRMAKMNLWREAMFRFQRAVQIDPNDAMAHNNLAVAYEANGDFENAMKEYREALRLDRSNQYIQKNYSRLVEFTQRSKKRDQAKPAAPVATTDTTAAPAPEPATPTTAPPPTDTTSTSTAAPPPPPGGVL